MTNARLSNRGSRPRIPHLIQIPIVLIFIISTFFLFYVTSLDHTHNVHANSSGKLAGHVPALVKRSKVLGPTNPNTPISLVVGLYLRNQADLEAFVNTTRVTSLTLGRHVLTSEQFVENFGPLQSSQDTVIAYMQRAGFKLTQTFSHHLLIDFKGTIGLAEKAFKVQINNYRAPDGRQVFAPTTNPTLPASLSPIVQGIVGLDDISHFSHASAYSPRIMKMAKPRSSSNINCVTQNTSYYTPDQVATAYNLKGLIATDGLHGEKQKLALFELDDYLGTDISTYYDSCTGTSSVPVAVNRIPIDGGVVAPGTDALKVETDMELVLSTATKLAVLQVYEAPNTVQGVLDAWSQIITDNVPVVSTSWGTCEANITSAYANEENSLFMTAAAQGQSIFAASGNFGSNDCQYQTPTSPSVDDPSSQPYVTGVGGTTLIVHSSNNTHNAEIVWNDGRGHAGGGGVSSFWILPYWQQGPGVTNSIYSSSSICAANTGSTGNFCREVPDVSLNADPAIGYIVYCTVAPAGCNSNQAWKVVGGTGAAAAMWAAMIALANEKSVNDGHSNLGFLNPLLYAINQNPSEYSSDFYDIRGSNNYTTNDGNGEYPAATNYDMASGLGSYNATSLATDLENLAQNPPPVPTVTPTTTVTPTMTTTVTPTTTTMVTPTVTTTPTTQSPPVNSTWYFAEGKVGQGFIEYITIENPDPANACQVNIEYLSTLPNGNPLTPLTVPVRVNAASRFTESVNSDLSTSSIAPSYLAVSTIVKVDTGTTPNCKGVVAERPIYFTNFNGGVSSGSDVLGATQLGQFFYFADIPTEGGYSSFITILNPPGASPAHITVNYYSGGQLLGTQYQAVSPGARGTIIPTRFNLRAIAVVTSDQPVVIERPSYFYNIAAGNAGSASGAASVVGAPHPANDWLFAEGYTGGQFQEFLMLANFDTVNSTTATVTLEYQNGHTQKVQVPVSANSQAIVNVNALHDTPTGTCDSNPCQVSTDVSADVSAPSPIVAEREMFFQYNNGHGLAAVGGTDVTGMSASPASAYSFAEGYTNKGYNEWLTLQNPTGNSEVISVTLVNEYGQIYNQSFTVVAYSRFTIDITGLVAQNLVQPGADFRAYEVSMSLQSIGGPFVAERPMYWYTGSGLTFTQGGSDVIGYSGG